LGKGRVVMTKTIHKKESKHSEWSHIPDTEAAIATRLAGGAVLGASLGAIAGVPGAVIGGLAGAVVLGSAPYLIVLTRHDGKNGNHTG
jgi:hypothetical protein